MKLQAGRVMCTMQGRRLELDNTSKLYRNKDGSHYLTCAQGDFNLNDKELEALIQLIYLGEDL